MTPEAAAAEACRADEQRARCDRARLGTEVRAPVLVLTALVDPRAPRERAIAAAEARGRTEDEAQGAAMAAKKPHMAAWLRLEAPEGMPHGP